MYFSHISIGGGITGLETIISTFAKIKKELQKSQNAKKQGSAKSTQNHKNDKGYKM